MADYVGKKLINSVDRCVDESLEGFVRSNGGVQLLEGHRIVVRADITEVIKSGKVTLISGGGSGHEPAHAGYVGRGMLSAVVAGSVFASPPPGEILTAIKTVGSKDAGTLLIVKNYTGDRLNFGLAAEKARIEGYKVDMVVVNEDCALTAADKTAGRRGLCGTVLIHKMAGALAEEGTSLEEMVTSLTDAVRLMGTIGVSLSPCSVPGSGPSFTLASDEIELGLGIHGEAGVKRMKLMSACEVVQTMIGHMTNPSSQTCLNLQQGHEVACMVNNLGGTSVLEMNILANEVCTNLEKRGVKVTHLYNGTFMTSLEMAGFSITILILNSLFRECLDSPTSAPGWVLPHHPTGSEHRKCVVVRKSEDRISHGAQMSREHQSEVFTAVHGACEALISSEAELNMLDSQSGDGDCGTTLRRGAQAVLEVLEAKGPSVGNLAQLFIVLSETVQQVMGGSSGALYSLFLTAAAGPLSSCVSVATFREAITAGIAAIQKYGGASPGDRTLLDALHPACNKLATIEDSSSGAADILSQMADAAEVGVQSTIGMEAHAGRASYVSSNLLTKEDPGAKGVAIILRAASNALMSKK